MDTDTHPLSQYSAAAVFSRMFTETLIQVKKSSMGYRQRAGESAGQPDPKRKDLAFMLESILTFLHPGEDTPGYNWIGQRFLVYLQASCSQPDRLEDDLECLRQKLLEDEDLSQEDFDLLDEIAIAADKLAAHTFKQMRQD